MCLIYISPTKMKTEFIKKAELKKNWVLIDAENAVLGRLAVISANILRGKNKVNYSPNSDCGDYLIIINSDKIKFTGKKLKDKIYNRHTGYPGGLKSTNPKRLIEEDKSDNIIKYAIKRMIPKGPLGSKQLSNCKIYRKDVHPHEAQNPKLINIKELNRKNIRS
ncbi:MAG: 50S ribosomal protein L13 [Alphaproteobacteria bacterium MarineAlpha5_Bin12]|nr:MAG: 50S ribosomal protein L13 [Alphaproteobacteria bacterium MarineAlpha5_Bin12]